MTPAALSHGVAALAFGLFAALLLANAGARKAQAPLLAACCASALWSLAAAAATAATAAALTPGFPGALHGAWQTAAPVATHMLEALRGAAWLACLLLLVAPSVPRKRVLLPLAALLGAQLAGVQWMAEAGGLRSWWQAAAAIAPRLLLAVAGLLLVEQLYRCSTEKWAIKYACLGIGAIFAYDFFLYSDAMLFRRVHTDLATARGLANALCVPLLAIAAARRSDWSLRLALSRQMMLRSTALTGSALYLLAMAASGWYLRKAGGSWGALMQLASFVAAALVLLAMLASGTVRAGLRVWIAKHFYASRYDYREEWMRVTRVLSASGERSGEGAVQSLAGLLDAGSGALWLRRQQHFMPAATWNLPPQAGKEPVGSAFSTLLGAGWIADVREAAMPAWLRSLPGLALVVPLRLNGCLTGFVALARPPQEVELSWELRDLLQLAGAQAASWIAHSELADELAVARQFESVNRISTFVMHDVKNLMGQLSLLLANAERHGDDPEFQSDMRASLSHALGRMAALQQRLRGSGETGTAAVELTPLLQALVLGYATAAPRPLLEIAAVGLCARADETRLERALAHLLQNALDATPADGTVTLHLSSAAGQARIEIRDTGHGMSESFVRERLFQPFASTKPGGMGIGVFESREYLHQMGARLEVESTAGRGSVFRVLLPLHCAAEAA